MCDQLTDHLARNHLCDPLQSAYKRGHSTETALLQVKGDIDMALDRGEGTLLLLLDLSAAFDTVDHNVLLKRLYESGISALSWMESYLSDRSQVVDVGGSRSQEFSLSTGVPQGSVLGPVLFLCYIKPLADTISQLSTHRHGYADDTQLYAHFKLNNLSSLRSAITQLEVCVQHIRSWMTVNKLMLNDSKTELLVVAPKNHMDAILASEPWVRVGDSIIKPCEKVRDLGAMLDMHMSMVPQVNNTCKLAYHHLRLIGKVRKLITKEACIKAVNALVTSRLDYNNGLLLSLPSSLLSRLQVVQNSAARLIAGVRRRDHITPTLRSLHWLPVKERIVYKLMLVTYKVVNNLSPPAYLSSLLQAYTPARQLRSGNRSLLQVPVIHRKAGERSFHHGAPSLWNSLDLKVKQTQTIGSFKRHLKTYLFNRST